jgi:hypothetical protein
MVGIDRRLAVLLQVDDRAILEVVQVGHREPLLDIVTLTVCYAQHETFVCGILLY